MSPIYSSRFDDIYFSEQDGLAESIHIFIEGNDIYKRLQNNREIIAGELGFGTGLNFLALCDYAEKHVPGAIIEYWSIEKYPLAGEQIGEALSGWKSIDKYLNRFLGIYDSPVSGQSAENNMRSYQLNENIQLNLLTGEAGEMIERFPDTIDCWFLDGFAPEKNPEMWNAELFRTCYEKSAPDATAATFTAAGIVKQNLRAAGFFVKRQKGYGKKRHMVKAYKTAP